MEDDFQLLLQHQHSNPHSYLGLHPFEDKQVIRVWRPGAETVSIDLKGEKIPMKRVKAEGLFECIVDREIKPFDYRIYDQEMLSYDGYNFEMTFTEEDCKRFHDGKHYELYDVMGSHYIKHKQCEGVKFALWAPHASSVSVAGDFNDWIGSTHIMRKLEPWGVWECFIPNARKGEKYKYEVRTAEGHLRVKTDPYAFFCEKRPHTATIISDTDQFAWTDEAWLKKRKFQKKPFPMNIYEVHLGSWKKLDGGFPNYRELAHHLAEYCLEMGYTHIELLPIMEHPLDESWGYQVTGFFAVTSRYGTIEDFQYFVNYMHDKELGVILDWVPGHFPTDDFSLSRFDGTPLYEYKDPRLGFHPDWTTHVFDYASFRVCNFLLASALFWFDKYHIDGLRVDAVASLIYRDYSRKEGEWIPNEYGGNLNHEAIDFVKHMNSIVHQKFPEVLMIAEESTAYEGVSKSVDEGGLGFDLKWNLGWMNDTFTFFEKDYPFRPHHHNDLTFPLVYAFNERFLLVLSHDEVVHEKKSLISKMPGSEWEKFANLRLLLSYMTCHPGKNLLFMGGEIGQWHEWNCKDQVHWHLLENPLHQKTQIFVKELNHFYRATNPLWEKDFDPKGFQWISFPDNVNSVLSYYRIGAEHKLICIHNFRPEAQKNYLVESPNGKEVQEIFNTDIEEYGGTNLVNSNIKVETNGFRVNLAPLSTQIFQVL